MAGKVAIRFSVENEAVVRQALQNLGKDGEKALRQLDAVSGKPSGGLRSISALIDEMRGRATGLAFSIGPVGTGLVALGPAGLAAAAAIGVTAKAFGLASEKAAELSERARQLKQIAGATGLGVGDVQRVLNAGSALGIDADQSAQFLDKLTESIEGLRRGSGPLFDELLRIDGQLLRQVASAGDAENAIEALARGYNRLTDAGQRAKLLSAIAGKGGSERGGILDAIAADGLEGLQRFGSVMDTQVIDRMAKARAEIEAIRRETSEAWWGPSEKVLAAQKQYAESWRDIVKWIGEANTSATAWAREFFAPANRWLARTTGIATIGTPPPHQLPFGESSELAGMPAARQSLQDRFPNATALGILRREVAVLGEAITPTEQLRLKILELNAAQEAGGVSDAARARSLGAFTLAQERAAVATRTALGGAGEEELLKQRLRDLDDAQAKGYIKNAEERATAERLVRKEVLETTEAIRVRQSEFPALEKLSIDAGKLQQNLDEGLAGALRGSTQSILDMAKGTKTLSAGLSDLSSKILDAVANAIIMKTIVGPIASGISGGLSGLFGRNGGWAAGTTVIPSARGHIFDMEGLVPFARGGVVSRPTIFPFAGGAGVMSEAGPEAIMPLRRLGNSRLGVEAGDSQSVAPVKVEINNYSAAKVSTREESDGRGGRKVVATIEDMVARAFERPGSSALGALRSAGTIAAR